jgi:hypothetical protein
MENLGFRFANVHDGCNPFIHLSYSAVNIGTNVVFKCNAVKYHYDVIMEKLFVRNLVE